MSTLLEWLAWCATGGLILGGALRLGPSSLRQARERPGLLLRFLFVVWIAAPALTFAVTQVFDLRGVAGAMLFLIAICPGVPGLLATTQSVGGSLHTALLVLLTTAITTPLLIPLWAAILSALHPIELTIPPRDLIFALLPSVFAPLLLGFGIRALSPKVAGALAGVTDVLFSVGVAVGTIAELIRGAPLLLEVPLRTILAVAIITFGEAWLGYWAGGPEEEDRRSTALAATLGNPALAFGVVAAGYASQKAGALVAAYVLLRALVLVPLKLWLKPGQPTRPHPADRLSTSSAR